MQSCVVYILLALAIALPLATAQEYRGRQTKWKFRDYPNSYSSDGANWERCGRSRKSYICDPNNIIPESEADEIDEVINSIRRETHCPCIQCRTQAQNQGYRVRVALMPEMVRVFDNGDDSSAARLQDAKHYTYLLTWLWGHTGHCNETVTVLYSRNDNILFTLTGKQARVKLYDSLVTRITMAVRHYFDNANTIGEGLIELLNRYKLVFEDKERQALVPSEDFDGNA